MNSLKSLITYFTLNYLNDNNIWNFILRRTCFHKELNKSQLKRKQNQKHWKKCISKNLIPLLKLSAALAIPKYTSGVGALLENELKNTLKTFFLNKYMLKQNDSSNSLLIIILDECCELSMSFFIH